MAAADPRIVTIAPTDDDRAGLAELARRLDAPGDSGSASGDVGEQLHLPAPLISALRVLTRQLAAGRAVAIVPIGRDLTTQEAADLIGVSRPYLVRLLEEGKLPFTRTGRHRRIRLEDVLSYREQQRRERRHQLDELVRLSEDGGLYRD